MSDRYDDAALDLLDRADELSPAMRVDPEAVIDRGRHKVRRRRVSATTGLGAMALVGALWLGGPLNPFAPGDVPAPAAVSWQEGVVVQLFEIQPNAVHEPDRVHWTGVLRSGEGDAYPELLLTRDGEELEPVPAQDGPGDVMVFAVDGLSVAVWQPPVGSLGESPLWAPGVHSSQAGPVEVEGAPLRYHAAEFVPGTTGELEELYWFSEQEGHAASGAPVSSTVLTAGGARAVVMVDEAREAWGTMPLGEHGPRSVERLVGGAGVTGWLGAEISGTSVGVLPPGASAPSVVSERAVLAQTGLGTRTAVLASDPALGSTAPVVRFTLDGVEHTLESFVRSEAVTITVGGTPVTVVAMPDAVELQLGPAWRARLPATDLTGDTAISTWVGDAHLVAVPGWDTGSAAFDDLRILVGTDEEQEWVPASSSLATWLFDGRPLILLGLDEGMLGKGETVRGVGVLEGGAVVEHELTGGVAQRDLGH